MRSSVSPLRTRVNVTGRPACCRSIAWNALRSAIALPSHRTTMSPGSRFARDAASSWEITEVRAPSAYLLADGRVRLLYEAGGAIGEAESQDGTRFARVDPDPTTPAIEPILGPSAMPPEGSLAPHEKPPFDTGSVGDPCALPRITIADRYQLRVLYTGRAVEHAPTARLLSAPLHPYTRGLLGCIPTPGETGRRKTLGYIPGVVPRPIGELSACNFLERCACAEAICREGPVALITPSEGRAVRCRLVEGGSRAQERRREVQPA